MTPQPVVLYGASGYTISIRDMIGDGHANAFTVAAYIDDFTGHEGRTIDGAPVIGFDAWHTGFAHLPVLIGVGDPAARRALAGRIAGAGGHFATAVPLGGSLARNTVLGEGAIVGLPAYIGPGTTLGPHAHVMPMTVIGHDVTLGACVTLCSSCSVAGYVHIEDEVFLGVGTVVVNGTARRPLVIGRGAHLSAGAVVTKSVPPGARLAGNPARTLRQLAARRGKAP